MSAKKIVLIVAAAILFGAWCFAAETDGESKSLDADVAIRFYDRRVYYPGNDGTEPIFVKISITNKGSHPLRFKLANDRMFSNTDQQIYFREITIETGETYAFVENVKDYITIESPGAYILSANFYPELKRLSDSSESHISSNRLGLEIKPSPSAAALGAVPIASVSREVLQPQPISPDKVISYMLTARQKSQWDQFFLYLDIERMIARDPIRSRRYKAEAEAGRINMLDTYKHDLMQSRTDKDIAMIPVEFTIERTTYSTTEAEVTVIEWFDYTSFREKKRFTYNLASRDDIWTVYDYSVNNLGTE